MNFGLFLLIPLVVLVVWVCFGVLILFINDIVEFFEQKFCEIKKRRITNAINKEDYIYLSKVIKKWKERITDFAEETNHSWTNKIYGTDFEIAEVLCNSIAKEFKDPKLSLSQLKEKHKRYAVFLYNNLFQNVDFSHSESGFNMLNPKDPSYYMIEEFLKYILSAINDYFTSDFLQDPKLLEKNTSLFYMLVYMISTDEDSEIGPLIIEKYMESLKKWKSAKTRCTVNEELLSLYKSTIDMFDNYEENNPDFYHHCLENHRVEIEGFVIKLQNRIKKNKCKDKNIKD